ncbi:hypothetical protein O3M35_003844 [Rhynocoris fuscipes]|uniref:TGF-beta family profile domain-containing protein n=1 Tax=Rhynocoris fuscipes TaxID=488301 RepID=A0AAW1CNX0_9HEMI
MRLRSPSLNVLVDKETNIRKKRQLLHNQARRTDCYPGAKKRRCCRHTMEVVFKELPGYEFVLQPYGFDAGYCKGPCPYRYNPANHHSSLQSLIWKQKKVGAKPCCAPSKLDKLEILHLDEHDNTKLKVASWSNMMVLECACF